MGANLVTIIRNLQVSTETFGPDDHDVHDGCVTPGQHKLLRFDFLSHNAGDADLEVGRPEDHPDWFVWSGGHDHYHLKDFNTFNLFNAQGQEVQIGHKQAFCLMDSERIHPNSAANPRFTCSYQGVQWGWADLYYASLPCQYIVIDGIADGDYTLKSATNSQRMLSEDCYADNTMWTGIRLQGNTATEIAPPWIGPEDKLRIDPDKVSARQIQGRWKVVEDTNAGVHLIMDFDQKRLAAERAVEVIKHYRLGFVCYVGRPRCSTHKPAMYWLTTEGLAPVGAMANEDAIGFNPAALQVVKVGQTWKIAEGNHWLLDFGPAEGIAKATLYFILKHQFRVMCFCGRPNPGMTYFRK